MIEQWNDMRCSILSACVEMRGFCVDMPVNLTAACSQTQITAALHFWVYIGVCFRHTVDFMYISVSDLITEYFGKRTGSSMISIFITRAILYACAL